MATPACKQCGTTMEPDARFCGVCGRALTPERNQAVALPSPAPASRAALAAAETTRAELPSNRRPGLTGPRPAPAASSPSNRQRINTRPPVATLDRLVGQTLNGRYVVEKKIGEGGFGSVFRGRQVATGRQV